MSTGYSIDATKVNENKKKISTTTPTCFFDKFVIAYACFMMFFIETPLGPS
jgi:lipopolysaccharide export system permease protein